MSRIENFEFTRGGGDFGFTGDKSKDGEEGHERTEFKSKLLLTFATS